MKTNLMMKQIESREKVLHSDYSNYINWDVSLIVLVSTTSHTSSPNNVKTRNQSPRPGALYQTRAEGKFVSLHFYLAPLQVIFETITGSGHRGDISVEGITLGINEECKFHPEKAQLRTSGENSRNDPCNAALVSFLSAKSSDIRLF